MKTSFWMNVLRYGAIIGAVLAVSTMVESRMQMQGHFGVYVIEFFALAAVHYYLLHRFTATQSRLYTTEEGFTFGQGYGYLLSMSVVSGVVCGAVQYLYLHFVVGYSNYMERVADSLMTWLNANGGVSSSMEGMFSQAFSQMQTAAEPTILSNIMGAVFSNLLFGALFGLIVAGVLARAPRPFDNTGDTAEYESKNE